jgi:hypothetical protein
VSSKMALKNAPEWGLRMSNQFALSAPPRAYRVSPPFDILLHLACHETLVSAPHSALSSDSLSFVRVS